MFDFIYLTDHSSLHLSDSLHLSLILHCHLLSHISQLSLYFIALHLLAYPIHPQSTPLQPSILHPSFALYLYVFQHFFKSLLFHHFPSC